MGVKGIDETTKRLHPLDELRPELPEAFRGKVVLVEGVIDGVGRKLGRAQRQEDTGGVDRVDEAKSVPDQDPSVSGNLTRVIGEVLEHPDRARLLGSFESAQQ